MRSRLHLWLVAAAVVSGCSARPPVAPLPRPAETSGLEEILARNPMPASANIHPVLISRSKASSRHLIQIRGREQPHVHASHDLVVFIVRGEGVLHVAGSAHPLSEGAVAVIDRGIPHWFENTGPEPAAAFVVFAPPYDGSDNVPVD